MELLSNINKIAFFLAVKKCPFFLPHCDVTSSLQLSWHHFLFVSPLGRSWPSRQVLSSLGQA